MEIISVKIDKKVLVILQNKFRHLQLPIDSLYSLQQFVIDNRGQYNIDSISRIVFNSDGLYLEGDKKRVEEIISTPVDDIKKIKKGLTNTSIIAFAFAGLGVISQYSAMSWNKYPTVDFCFMPEVLHSTPKSEFCKSGETVFRTSPNFLAKKDSILPNAEFLDGNEKLIIPAKGRRIVGENPPTNPNYLIFAGISVLFSSSSYWLFKSSQERFQLEFPKYFSNVKTYLLNVQLDSQVEQEISKTLKNHHANFLVDSKLADANAQIQSFGKSHQQLLEESEQAQLQAIEDSEKAKKLQQQEFELALANLEKLTFENLKDKAKYANQRRKYDNNEEVLDDNPKDKNFSETSEETEINNQQQEKNIQEVKKTFSHAVKDGVKPLDKSEDITWGVLNQVLLSPLSSIIVGTTGAGKTILETAWFHEASKKNSEIEFHAIVQKQDYPTVLDESPNSIEFFDMDNPEKALAQIQKVYNIYKQRRQVVRNVEENGEKFSPVRLVLSDWLSINKALEDLSKTDEVIKAFNLYIKLNDIVLNGRACNVALIADLQSFNVKAIGLEADSNIRQNLNILCLGNHSIASDGTVNNSYGVLENIIKSHNVISEVEIREKLKKEYKRLQPKSHKNSRPILFSSLYPVSLSMVPDLRSYGGV